MTNATQGNFRVTEAMDVAYATNKQTVQLKLLENVTKLIYISNDRKAHGKCTWAEKSFQSVYIQASML